MDLIRLLLLAQEGEEPAPDLSGYTTDQQVYHWRLLIEAGFVAGQTLDDKTGIPRAVALKYLTWEGHEFLDVARAEGNWKHVTKAVAKSGGNWTLSILKDGLKAYALHELAKHGFDPGGP